MKKVLIFTLLFIPTLSFAAPSVRMLGSKAPATTVTQSETKSTSAKSSAGLARIGTLRANNKVTTTNATGAITSSNSRFPVITPAHSYSSVQTPSVTSGGGTTTIVSGVDEAAIADAVAALKDEIIQEIADDYYDKDEFDEAVQAAVLDDPRFDAIRLINPANASNRRGQNFPASTDSGDGYVYIWIEK